VISSPPLSFVPHAPGRLADTRIGSRDWGVPKGRIPAYGSLTIKPFDRTGPQAVVLSVTVVRPSAYGSLGVGPTAATATTALSFSPGEIRTAAVTTLTMEGQDGFVVYNHSPGSIDLVIDSTGFSTQFGGGSAGPQFGSPDVSPTPGSASEWPGAGFRRAACSSCQYRTSTSPK